MNNFKILIVDDKEENIYTLRLLISDNFPNADVFEASNAQDALSIIMNNSINLILSDIQMPEISGFDLVSYLSEIDETKNIPVVLITAKFLDKNSQNKGFTLGATDYICKPINPEEFCNKIRLYEEEFESKTKKYDAFSELERKILEDVKVKNMLEKLETYDNTLLDYKDFLDKKDSIDKEELEYYKRKIDELMK